jgi:hypothetical protein
MLIQQEDMVEVVNNKVCLEIPPWRLRIDLEPARRRKDEDAKQLLKRIEVGLRPCTGDAQRVPTPMQTMRHAVSHTEPVAMLLRSVSDHEARRSSAAKEER